MVSHATDGMPAQVKTQDYLLKKICAFLGAARVPVFMIASASEVKKGSTGSAGSKKSSPTPPLPPPQPPAWRSFVGNLAAGAVSGCAVEAGAQLISCKTYGLALGSFLTHYFCHHRHHPLHPHVSSTFI